MLNYPRHKSYVRNITQETFQLSFNILLIMASLRTKLRILNILMALGIVAPGYKLDLKTENMNICRPPLTHTERLQVGDPVETMELYTGDVSKTLEILASLNESNFSPVHDDMVNYIILPLNFPEPTELAQQIEMLNRIFHPLGINFAYTDKKYTCYY